MSLLSGASPTGLTLPEAMTYSEWAEVGTVLETMNSATPWLRGDWWLHGEHRYGESASQAAPTGAAIKTLQNAAWTAGRIERSRRREALTFGHHACVAAMDEVDQDELLDLAEAHAWSVSRLRQEVSGRRRTDEAMDEVAASFDPLDAALCALLHDAELLAACDTATLARQAAESALKRLSVIAALIATTAAEIERVPRG